MLDWTFTALLGVRLTFSFPVSVDYTGIEGQSGKNMCQGGKPDTGKFHSSYIGMNVCGSAYENRCVVDNMCAMAAD